MLPEWGLRCLFVPLLWISITSRNEAMFAIDFEWLRDDAGYNYVPAAPGNPDPSEMSPLYELIEPIRRVVSGGKPARIVRRGGNLVPYRPLETGGGKLYQIFATLGSTEEELVEFINRFGPLTQYGNEKCGEELLHGLSAASVMRDLLFCSVSERATYFSKFGKEGVAWSRIDVALTFNPMTNKSQFRLTPPNLVNALWLELGQALSSDASIRNCLHCGGWFEAGPGTGRREDAKFCSDPHRIAFNSRKRSKGGAEHA
jgi:hypothetical protein